MTIAFAKGTVPEAAARAYFTEDFKFYDAFIKLIHSIIHDGHLKKEEKLPIRYFLEDLQKVCFHFLVFHTRFDLTGHVSTG